MGPLPHRSVHERSKKYGPIMHLKFGSKNVVIGPSVEMVTVFLKTMDINFVCRPKNAAGKYTTYNYSDITWAPYGPYWRQAQEMKSLLKALHKSAGEEIVLKDLLSTFSLNVISQVVLGKKYLNESEAEESMVSGDEFKKMLDELFLLNGVLNIGDWIPWMGFLDIQGYVKRIKILTKKFDPFLKHVLNEHDASRKLEGDSFVPKDMVDMLLRIADDTTLDVKLKRHSIKGFTQ
nr:cytochrome P450 71A1-like [Tanacetum cinerariifolium]